MGWYDRRVIAPTYLPAHRLHHGGTPMLKSAGRHGQRGQGLAEYALILSLIAIAAIAALLVLGGVIQNILSQIGAAL